MKMTKAYQTDHLILRKRKIGYTSYFTVGSTDP